MYLPRVLQKFIEGPASRFPALLVTGARQVGKTTLLRKVGGSHRRYVTLDDPLALRLAREDPALFLARNPPPVLIDEIQYAPGLLPLIKMAIDSHPQPAMFWMTGSQQFHLMQGVSESLAGRVAIVNLLGLSHREAVGERVSAMPFSPGERAGTERDVGKAMPGLMDLYRQIWRGSFPALAVDPALDRDLFYASYLQTYLQRDVRDLARVGDETAFVRFLRAVAARTGQLLNFADLARDADVAPNTAKNWLSILETSGVVFSLEPWHTNVVKRLVKAPKLYFLDTGLAAYLTGWSSPETLEAGAMAGALLETWVVGEILKSWHHAGLRPPLWYYRDKDKKEIDLLIVRDNILFPVEIKKTASPHPEDVRHFGALERLGQPVGQGGLICLVPQRSPLTRAADAIPWWDL